MTVIEPPSTSVSWLALSWLAASRRRAQGLLSGVGAPGRDGPAAASLAAVPATPARLSA